MELNKNNEVIKTSLYCHALLSKCDIIWKIILTCYRCFELFSMTHHDRIVALLYNTPLEFTRYNCTPPYENKQNKEND